MLRRESGLPYEVHLSDFNKDDQRRHEFFLSLNPNGQNSGDPRFPTDRVAALSAVRVWRDPAISAAEKTGKLFA